MVLTPERYTEVDAELQRIEEYLLALTNEIAAAAPGKANKEVYIAMGLAAGRVGRARLLLTDAQEKQ